MGLRYLSTSYNIRPWWLEKCKVAKVSVKCFKSLIRMGMLYQFSRKITDEMIRKARWGWTESPEDFGHMIDHKWRLTFNYISPVQRLHWFFYLPFARRRIIYVLHSKSECQRTSHSLTKSACITLWFCPLKVMVHIRFTV